MAEILLRRSSRGTERLAERGYTLVELLVVIAILGMLAVIGLFIAAIPAIIGAARPGAEARAAAYALANDLRATRNAAVVSGEESAVLFDPKANDYTIEPGHVLHRFAASVRFDFQ